MIKTTHAIIQGDSRQMSELKDGSVIKIGVDKTVEFRYKNKFLTL